MQVLLNGGHTALIDDADANSIAGYRWRTWKPRTGHAVYVIAGSGMNKVLMHRLVMGFPSGRQVDHINGDGLDNRRSNLRLASMSQQQMNRTATGWGRSGYKGVTFHGATGLWMARCTKDGKCQTVYRKSVEEAAKAYDQLARQTFGEFARLNFPGTV